MNMSIFPYIYSITEFEKKCPCLSGGDINSSQEPIRVIVSFLFLLLAKAQKAKMK